MAKKKWKGERLEKLRSLYPYYRNRELALIFETSECSIVQMAYNLRLRKDPAKIREWSSKGFFVKGHIPANKGKKQSEYMSPEKIKNVIATRFKKGNVPLNTKPVGYERKCSDGYIYIKVPGKKKMVLKHRYVWESHNGPIPHGYNIQFKDDDRTNCEISNLYMISRKSQLITQNSIHAMPDDLRKIIQLKGVLTRQINKQKNKYE